MIRSKYLRDQPKVTYAISLKGDSRWYSGVNVLRTGDAGHWKDRRLWTLWSSTAAPFSTAWSSGEFVRYV